MNIKIKPMAWHTLALSATMAAALVACGGGSGGAGTTATPVTLRGVAATGAAFEGATITVTDRTGAVVGTSSTVGSDGTFSITLSATAQAPFVLTATRTNAEGVAESLVSVVPEASGTSSTVNVSPVTTLIASRLSPNGDPAQLSAQVASNPSLVTSSTVSTTVSDVQAILAPVLTATGTSTTNPLTGTFATDGTGYDRLLDAIKVTITPTATSANIEIGIKQQLAEGTDPTIIQLSNTTPVATVQATAPTIAPNTLLESGTSALIQNHLTQLTNCFAQATANRVSNPNPSGSSNIAAASQANVLAGTCRDAFIQTGGVIDFKSNGSVIGAKATSAFRGLFFDGGTGTTFSQGSYEFTRGNGDIVVGYKKTDTSGAVSYDTFVLRKDTDGKLKQIGNQYNYPGGVSAYHQLRRFMTLGQSAYDYYSTGYTLSVNHITGGTGTDGSIFDRVEVTTPRGSVLTLKPEAGYSNLNLVYPSTGAAGSNFLRLRSEYVDTANTADPKLKESARLFFSLNVPTNDQLAAIPAQSVWKFDYFLAGNTTTTPDATQFYKTRARALTIPELRAKSFARLTDASIAALQTNVVPSTATSFVGMKPIGGESLVSLTWTVPSGALAPTGIQIWGPYTYNGVTAGFNDSASVRSTATSGSVSCTSTGTGDNHCTSGAYTNPAYLNGAHLWARDTGGREYASFYAAYKLNP